MRPLAKLCLVAVVGSGAAFVAFACSDDPHRRTSPEQALGGGGACEAKSGSLPAPDCDNSERLCTPSPGCTIDEARCGPPSTCLPIGNNAGKSVLDFRMRRLNIAAPPALAADFIQNTVVNLNIDLAENSCAEKGKGLFTWLLRIDKTAGTLVTGGSPPSDDPLGRGFCFARFDLGSTRVEPFATKIAFTGNTFKSTEPGSVNIPIFLTEQIASAIVLPIRGARIDGVSISDDGNCIGTFNTAALTPSCDEDRTLCSKWNTSGALGGYITLEEADKIRIREINNKSLCSFLSAATETECPRDPQGKILYKGDFCSTTNTPDGCQDSVWLAATFAASAVKIFDGQGTVEACSGLSSDAGSDAEADAATDAPDAD